MIETIIILVVCAGVFLFLEWPRISTNRFWRATVTPLASIIGSGFLVIGPILDHAFGGYAPLAMLALCVMAYLFGIAVRENIRYRHDDVPDSKAVTRVATGSSWALSLAYVVSVAYYLNLFGVFAVRMTSLDAEIYPRVLTTIMFLIVLGVGWTKGFKALEHLELHSVTVKLAIIGGLIAGLAINMSFKASDGGLLFNPMTVSPYSAITLVFGLIVTVQGFEISRYLGSTYSPATRISSMRFAQLLCTAIYMAYILLMSYVFHPEDIPLEEAAIIDMMELVAPILPVLLIAAALAAQFSAAIADTGGAGGLVEELTRKKLTPKWTYAVLTAAGIAITWFADVFEIISYASRIFALYYALQAVEAALRAKDVETSPRRMILFGALAIVGLAVTLLGQPVE